MISQPLPNCKTEFFKEEDVGSYDNIALHQRYTYKFYSNFGANKNLIFILKRWVKNLWRLTHLTELRVVAAKRGVSLKKISNNLVMSLHVLSENIILLGGWREF